MAVICQVSGPYDRGNEWTFFIEKTKEPLPFKIRYKNMRGRSPTTFKRYDNFDECYHNMMIQFFDCVYGYRLKYRGQQWL
jgi:hypothetical protein